MTEIYREIWYPCALKPLANFDFEQWQPRDGLFVARISEEDKKCWEQITARYRLAENFEPNLVVKINEKKFFDSLKTQLCHDGFEEEIAKYEKIINKLFVELDKSDGTCVQKFLLLRPEDILRWVITSLCLCCSFSEISLPKNRLDFSDSLPGVSPTHIGFDRTSLSCIPSHLPEKISVEMNKLERIARNTERYFNLIIREIGPVSVALHCFWAFLFSRFPDQAYISLVTIFEALLSTGNNEISHQISERSAIILENAPEDRLRIYEAIKKLYDLRSKIVHGDIPKKKGPHRLGQQNNVSYLHQYTV